MVHTYNLFDDMPMCDNDLVRRGQPSVHAAFGEATALLCGDTLLTDSFAILSGLKYQNSNSEPPSEFLEHSTKALKMVAELAKASGIGGMVGGQAIDMQLGGRQNHATELEAVDYMHRLKTGCLMASAFTIGALSSDVGVDQLEDLRNIGHDIGLVFQILDDILDDSEASGKTVGKDQDLGKTTYLSLLGPKQSLQRAQTLTKRAVSLSLAQLRMTS